MLDPSAATVRQSPSGDAAWVPCELVSPVLKGRDGLLEVARVLTALNTLPIEVNKSTGLHVHVGEALRCLSWMNVCAAANHRK
jgi:hypothetical protein